jgi:hypothetical protein
VRNFLSYIACLLLGIVIGCSSDPEMTLSDKDYLPLKHGNYQVYAVDSTWYTPIDGEQSMHYELMTIVVDSFLNAEDQYTYVIHRYKRGDETQSWQYADTWSARVNNLRAVVAEYNREFVKFVLPVSDGKTWNGNTFNAEDEDEYELINTRKPSTVDDLHFEDCIEINQNHDDDPIVRTDIRSEVYARGVGLVKREVTILNFCTAGCGTFGEIETGVIYSQRIKEYDIQ